MEINNTDLTCACLWRPLRQAWRFLCCCVPENIGIQLSVEETAPSIGQSTVRPWFEECIEDGDTYHISSAQPSIEHHLTIQFGSSSITPTKSARNLGVMFDDTSQQPLELEDMCSTTS